MNQDPMTNNRFGPQKSGRLFDSLKPEAIYDKLTAAGLRPESETFDYGDLTQNTELTEKQKDLIREVRGIQAKQLKADMARNILAWSMDSIATIRKELDRVERTLKGILLGPAPIDTKEE